MKRTSDFILTLCMSAMMIANAYGLDRSITDEIDAVFADLDSVDSPGCAIGVIQDQQLVYGRGFGMASLEQRVPIDVNTVFYTGSVSKQFAAAAVLMAAREGHLRLDDDIRRWFPEIPDYGYVITVGHLVHHTSGLRDYLSLMALAGVPFEDIASADWVLELIARQQATSFVPGEEYQYSNSGYFLMGQLIERATGRSLRQYSEEKLFEPLGMRQTHFHDDRLEVVVGRAPAYAKSEEGGFVLNWSPNFAQVGSGGLLSTIVDMVEWDRSFYNGRLGEDFWDQMQVVGRLNDGEELDYAYGLVINEFRGHPRVHHGGAMFGYRSYIARIPEQELTVVVLCNSAQVNPARRSADVLGVLLAVEAVEAVEATGGNLTATAQDARSTANLTTAQLDRWVGDYTVVPGANIEVVRDGQGLAANFGGQRFALRALSASEFEMDRLAAPATSRLITFEAGDAGRSLSVEVGGASLIAKPLAPREADPRKLAQWVGTYWSDELAATAVIEQKGDVLTYQVGSTPAEGVVVRTDSSLTRGPTKAVAELDEDKRVGAFVIDAGGVRGIRFVRQN